MPDSLEDKLVDFCNRARAKGFTIKQGLWRNAQKRECCALGALCLLSETTDTKRSTARRAAKLLRVSNHWVRSFAAGFDYSSVTDGLQGALKKGEDGWFTPDPEAYRIGLNVSARVNPIFTPKAKK